MGRLRPRRHHLLSALFRDLRRLDRDAVRARDRTDQVSAAQDLGLRRLSAGAHAGALLQADALRRRRDGGEQDHLRPLRPSRSSTSSASTAISAWNARRSGCGSCATREGGLKSAPVPEEVLAKFRVSPSSCGAANGVSEARPVISSAASKDDGRLPFEARASARAPRGDDKQNHSTSAAIFFKICRNRLRSRRPMMRSRLRSCRRAQRVSWVSTFLPSAVRLSR